jgi:tetratricopeptide (TPR) repeat protein
MQVFLSSTGRDLKAHRDAAYKAIEGMDGFHCVRMEDFHGPAVRVEDFDTKKITECDLFVMILGHLYGTCPDGAGKSYTELEFDVSDKKTRFLFLAPEDFPLRADLYEDDAKRAKQRALRQRATGLIRNTFTSPDDLATQVVQSIRNWEQSAKAPARDGVFLPLPPQPYFAHPYPLQQNFTGRLRERKMLSDWLRGDRNMLSIVAIGGMGKSALTWAWLQRDVLGLPLPGVAQNDGEDCRILDAQRPEGVLWWSFYEREASFGAFAREALYYMSDGRASADSTYDAVRMLVSLLTRRRLLLVFDGFERELRAYAGLNAAYQGDDASEDFRDCVDPHAAAFLRGIASLPMASRVLLTSRLHPGELDGLAGCQRRDLTALDPDDAVTFFHAQGITGTRAEIQAACAPYGYHPLALRLLAGVIIKDHRNPRDIRAAAKHPVTAGLSHILQVSYDAMERPQRELLSRLAAFRNPMSYDALDAMNPFKRDAELDASLDELIGRGLLFFDPSHARYDLHPVVRQYAYDRLSDKTGVHTRLREYFTKIPPPDKNKLENLEDLDPTIELYHHTLRAGQYDEAAKLYLDRLSEPLYTRFGAYQVSLELLRGLFVDVEESQPRLKDGADQAAALCDIANSYAMSGQPRRSIPLLRKANAFYEQSNNKKYLTTGLGNLGSSQMPLGHLREGSESLRRSIDLCIEVGDKGYEATSRDELGRLETYQGRFEKSVSELDSAFSLFVEANQYTGVVWTYRATRAMLMGNAEEAVKCARQARELASLHRYERLIVPASWLLGSALIDSAPSSAADHLTDALTRCRRINMVDTEPDILLAWARWHRKQGNRGQALADAQEALAIAGRCEYRLVQADVHNFLAQVALDSNDRAAARNHAGIARERAWCDGPPHCYKPALDEADALLAKLS